MFGVNSINGSFQWLGVPAPLSTDGTPWTNYILVPITDCGTGGTATNLNWGSQHIRSCGSVAVSWSSPLCAMLAYVRKSKETYAELRSMSVTISFEIIVRRACKVSTFPAAPSAIVWSICGIATGVISRMSRLINNLCGEFLLVVSVSATFLFSPSLV